MKTPSLFHILTSIAMLFGFAVNAADDQTSIVHEYASVRIMGDNSSTVWPDGKVTMLLADTGLTRPKEVDHRMFWLTAAMNLTSRRGFDFQFMNGPDLVMHKRLSSEKTREFAAVRFTGDDSVIFWPDGKMTQLVTDSGLTRPKEADHRMFWLTVAMNLMGKKGYEFVFMDGSDLVMARPVN